MAKSTKHAGTKDATKRDASKKDASTKDGATKHAGKGAATLADGARLSELLRVPSGPVDMTTLDPAATTGFPGGKGDLEPQYAALAPSLSDLQERLFAQGRSDAPGDKPSVLVVLQGMDTSGKGGVIRHAIGLVDPQGVHLKAFKAPSAEERRHDFLWRIRRETPAPGMIGVFDRSHYEDVLVVRVDRLVPAKEWRARYDQINEFEAELASSGTRIVKCFLNVSPDAQRSRLAARLDDPSKYWKYNPGDLAARSKWPAYQEAYADLLERCNPDHAPWFHVPADRKWYRNWAVATLLNEALQDLNLTWPPATFDVAEERQRVARA